MSEMGRIRAAARLSVAPMMDWTDRHCRYFHRRLSRHALLYTEMVAAPALVRGGAAHLLGHDPEEQPLALQLGGADPAELAEAARLGAEAGFGEINLNVGCPSDRVQSGAFGAVLMRDPALVARCLSAMAEGVARGRAAAEITVKCRIGVDEQEPREVLPAFLEAVAAAGVRRVTIHARKAWLEGLSPKQNREVPPLDHPLVHEMKARFADLHVSLNGGIDSLDAAEAHLAQGLDGVMIGRAAYHRPADILLEADARIFAAAADAAPARSREEAARAMLPYVEAQLSRGVRLHQITRHMLGLFHGRPGGRIWRRMLSEGAHAPGAGPELIEAALAAMPRAA